MLIVNLLEETGGFRFFKDIFAKRKVGRIHDVTPEPTDHYAVVRAFLKSTVRQNAGETYLLSRDETSHCPVRNRSNSQPGLKRYSRQPEPPILFSVHGFTEILEPKVEIPIDNVPTVVVPLLELRSVPLVSELLDVKLMDGEVRTEDVFDFISFFELEALEV